MKDFNLLFMPTYARSGSPFVRGKGMYLFDTRGKKYLDFGAGIAVNALGHSHPSLIKVLFCQGKKLIHGSNLYLLKPQIELAKMLIEHSFGKRVFFCNSGTEAIEAAIKFSRKWALKISQDKYHILSFTNAFHGRTYGALSATPQGKFQTGFGPLLPGFHYAVFNDIKSSAEMLRQHQYAAIIVEPLQGEGGVYCASTDFLKFLRQYCDTYNIALIFDEIQCGLGRTGTLWNYQQHGVIPDIMVIAKPLGGGLPLGACICAEKFASAVTAGDHGSTFGGNPIACALGRQILSIISRPAFLKKVRLNGDYLINKLTETAQNNKCIRQIRGKGLLVGAELDFDPKEVVAKCKENGLLIIKAENNTVRFIPPLIVSKKDIDKAVAIFAKVLISLK